MKLFDSLKNVFVSKPKEVVVEIKYNGYNVFNQSIADAMISYENYKPGSLFTKDTTEEKTYYKNAELTILARPGYYSVGTKETGVTTRIVLDSKGTTFKIN